MKIELPPLLTPATEEQIAAWLALFVAPDQITELRCLPRDGLAERQQVAGGFFDGAHLADMAHEAKCFSATGNYTVYFTPNPLKPEVLERRENTCRVSKPKKGFAHDGDVLRRRWLLIDVDPVRADGHDKESSTDAEKAHAWEVALQVIAEFKESQWEQSPIVVDSGNGYHLYYQVNEEDSKPESETAHRVLQGLAFLFDNAHATIDTTVGNPARIMKVPGTVANKGQHTNERPHRVCKVM